MNKQWDFINITKDYVLAWLWRLGFLQQNLRDYFGSDSQVDTGYTPARHFIIDSERQAPRRHTWRWPWQHSTGVWRWRWRRTLRFQRIMRTARGFYHRQLQWRLFNPYLLSDPRYLWSEEWQRPWAEDRRGINLKGKPARGEQTSLQSLPLAGKTKPSPRCSGPTLSPIPWATSSPSLKRMTCCRRSLGFTSG